MKHKLKIEPKYFNAVKRGVKSFEIRKNDRGFEVGDQFILQQYENGEYTGAEVWGYICYVTDFEQKDSYVVFGLDIRGHCGRSQPTLNEEE